VWWAEPNSSEEVQAIQDRWCAAMHLIVKANADGDPAADGQNPEQLIAEIRRALEQYCSKAHSKGVDLES
jgi:hypothetical protein